MPANFWKNKKVLVTGGTGFIGSFVVERLLKNSADVSITTSSSHYENIDHIKGNIRIIKADLTNPLTAKKSARNQDIILHLASKVAGIQFNRDHPATMFSDNVTITRNILDAAVNNNIERILITSSACVYPRHCTVPTPETEGFIDDPEPTNLGYGWSKRVAELMGKFYAEEFKLKVAIARPYNTYGPKDNFDPQVSHVIPGLIKRVFQNENPLKIWGTGNQTRSFLYVEDLARGLLDITEKYTVDPVNIGTQEEISIGNLAKLIIKLSGKAMPIEFDTSKPDGQPRRNCDTTKAEETLNYHAEVSLEEGLQKTISWYKQHLLS